VDQTSDCQYKDILYPMGWLTRHHSKLAELWIKSPGGTLLDFNDCPFEKFITLTPDGGLANILTIFYFYIELYGVPKMSLIY
jgi:hypothetical protein